jgi:hypothetical protein
MNDSVAEYILTRLKVRRQFIGMIVPDSELHRNYCDFVDEVIGIIEEAEELRKLGEK